MTSRRRVNFSAVRHLLVSVFESYERDNRSIADNSFIHIHCRPDKTRESVTCSNPHHSNQHERRAKEAGYDRSDYWQENRRDW